MHEDDEDFVESSQDDEIELQIGVSSSVLICPFSLSEPLFPSTLSSIGCIAQDQDRFPELHSPHSQDTFHAASQDAFTQEHSYPSYSEPATQSSIFDGHHCDSQNSVFSTGYEGDFERPTPSPSGHSKLQVDSSTYQIFKTLKSDYKATCEECDIPYESQPTLPESFLQKDYDDYDNKEDSQFEPPAQISQTEQPNQPYDSHQETDSKSVDQNLVKLDKAAHLKTNNIRSPIFAPISSFSTRSLSRHRAAARACRAAQDIETLEGFLRRERRKYKRLMSIVLGTQ